MLTPSDTSIPSPLPDLTFILPDNGTTLPFRNAIPKRHPYDIRAAYDSNPLFSCNWSVTRL
jgi:hypothetical protein